MPIADVLECLQNDWLLRLHAKDDPGLDERHGSGCVIEISRERRLNGNASGEGKLRYKLKTMYCFLPHIYIGKEAGDDQRYKNLAAALGSPRKTGTLPRTRHLYTACIWTANTTAGTLYGEEG